MLQLTQNYLIQCEDIGAYFAKSTLLVAHPLFKSKFVFLIYLGQSLNMRD